MKTWGSFSRSVFTSCENLGEKLRFEPNQGEMKGVHETVAFSPQMAARARRPTLALKLCPKHARFCVLEKTQARTHFQGV
jgi:hypothetical protein